MACSEGFGRRIEKNSAKLLCTGNGGKTVPRFWGGGAAYKNIRVSEGHLVRWTALSLSLEKDE